ncbi:MAG: metallophosphoesterase [Candidatus Micrarchaeota archaeon]|nr:metallophosphoesterase [Candidatus Micrarchaeota archaeon]
MLVGKDIELVEGLPVMHIRSLRALVVSDLHLGYEGGMAKSGLAIPKANLKSVTGILAKAAKGRGVTRVIVVGDVKNDFSGVIGEEVNELREIVQAMKGISVAIEVVKGNHDNFLDSYSRALGIKVHGSQLLEGGYLFAHGDKQLPKSSGVVGTVIIGHEHPSIGIRSRAGTLERLRCFLHGTFSYAGRDTELIVLPAIGYFETGSDVNLRGRGGVMSPVLKKADIDQMEAIAIGDGLTLNFGRLKDLKDVT